MALQREQEREPLLGTEKGLDGQGSVARIESDGSASAKARSELVGLGIYTLSGFFFTVMASFAKLARAQGVPAVIIIFARSAVVLPIAAGVLVAQRPSNPLGKRKGMLILRSSLGGFANGLFFVGSTRLPLPDAMMLTYLSPLVSAVASSIFLKEPLKWYVLAAAVPCLAGTVLVSQPEVIFSKPSKLDPLGVVALLSHALCSGLAKVCLRALRSGQGSVAEPAHVVISYLALVTSTGAAVVCAFTCTACQLQNASQPRSLLWAFLCGAVGYLSQLTMTTGLGKAKAGPATACSYLSIVWSTVIGYFLFGDFPDILAWIGGCFIIASVVTMSLLQHRDNVRGR